MRILIILHLIPIQKRLVLISFTINIIQLEMIKETIVKLYTCTQCFQVTKILSYVFSFDLDNQRETIRALLHLPSLLLSKKAVKAFPRHFPPAHLCIHLTIQLWLVHQLPCQSKDLAAPF